MKEISHNMKPRNESSWFIKGVTGRTILLKPKRRSHSSRAKTPIYTRPVDRRTAITCYHCRLRDDNLLKPFPDES